MASLLRGHIAQIRELINELRPLALDQFGLVGALRHYVERFGEEAAIQASLTVAGSFPTDPLADVTIYRVVQESLNNVRRHAQASRVRVDLRVTDDDVEVTVSDDGRGFDMDVRADSRSGGLGLNSMWERAELIGGTFSVQSKPGQGTLTILRIPSKANAARASRTESPAPDGGAAVGR